MITEGLYWYKTGHYPTTNDLTRVNCDLAGTPGHSQCGWCYRCDRPRWQCLHTVEEATNRWVRVEQTSEGLFYLSMDSTEWLGPFADRDEAFRDWLRRLT